MPSGPADSSTDRRGRHSGAPRQPALPPGAVWDVFKDALLSSIKYASTPLNFNVPL